MKVEEKLTNKEKRAVIIRKYQQYLRLEKALSPNTLDAYMTDLQKLLHFLEGEGIAILDTTLDDLQHFASGLHDIGIHEAERQHGSSAGPYQEQEGPAVARPLLSAAGADESEIERICWLIAHHHSYGSIDGPDAQILAEADMLVNQYESGASRQQNEALYKRLYKTEAGKRLFRELYFETYDPGDKTNA